MNDPCTGLLNRLYARKRKELKARKNLKNVEIEEERVDDRSVDDLLLFINSGNEDSKGDDFDDDLDPLLMKELDREVEEFARRLNSV
ncbi:hypothetical protein Tco_0902224 [Tanacetum coccineum]